MTLDYGHRRKSGSEESLPCSHFRGWCVDMAPLVRAILTPEVILKLQSTAHYEKAPALKETTFPTCPGLKRKYVLFAASLLNYSFLSQSGLVLSEPAGQCGWLAFSMQKFFPGGKDDHKKMQIRHTKVCQSALETGEKVFTAGITFSLTAG